MAGVYIHIPFCRKACHYCNFHFSTSSAYKSDMLAAMEKEIKLSAAGRLISTIYFGGGTPSLLSADEIATLLQAAKKFFRVADGAEITL